MEIEKVVKRLLCDDRNGLQMGYYVVVVVTVACMLSVIAIGSDYCCCFCFHEQFFLSLLEYFLRRLCVGSV